MSVGKVIKTWTCSGFVQDASHKKISTLLQLFKFKARKRNMKKLLMLLEKSSTFWSLKRIESSEDYLVLKMIWWNQWLWPNFMRYFNRPRKAFKNKPKKSFEIKYPIVSSIIRFISLRRFIILDAQNRF